MHLLSASPFAEIVGIGARRFDQRRLRQPQLLPLSPTQPGKHGRFDAFDALRMRAVLALEALGLDFTAACEHVRSGAIAPEVMFDGGQDFYLAVWPDGGGQFRRLCGTARDIARACPAEAPAVTTLNLSVVLDEVRRNAAARSLSVRGTNFVEFTE